MSSETTPLIGLPTAGHSPTRQRVHFADNLRTVLTVLLIFHHSATHVVRRGLLTTSGEHAPSQDPTLPLALFITVNEAFLWGVFFFVSGYVAHVQLQLQLEAKPDARFLRSRACKTVLPALVYLGAGRELVVRLFEWVGLEGVFGRGPGGLSDSWARDQLSGPGAYIAFLAVLDSGYLALRYAARRYPELQSLAMNNETRAPKSKFLTLLSHSFVLLTGATFLNCLGVQFVPSIFHRTFPLDAPGFGAPFTYILAYTAGAHYPVLAQHLLITTPAGAVGALIASELFAYTSLSAAQERSGALWSFIRASEGEGEGARWFRDGGLNLHTAFFSLWSPIVMYAFSVSLVSVFASARTTGVDWGWWSKRTWIAAYVHMIPVLVASYVVEKARLVDSPVLKTVVIGFSGAVDSWMAIFIVAKASPKLKEMYRRYMD